MFRVLMILAVVIVSGCATHSLTPNPVSKSNLNETQGILFGSFSRNPSGPKYYSQTFYFRNISTNERYEIKSQPTFNMFSGKTPDDFKASDSHGAIFLFALPAGKYTFSNFRLYQSNGTFSQNWTSKEEYSIPFEILPNRVNYAGEIKISPLLGKNIFGMKVQAGGVWYISDEKIRDITLMQKLNPGIPMDDVVVVIPEKKEVFTPLVVLPSEIDSINN